MIAYHLLSAENGLSDISLRRLKISRFRDLNDPFELKAVRTDNIPFSKALNSWAKEFDRDNGLLCFSKNWHNPVLWSHYASKHRGMCLGFEIADDILGHIRYSDSEHRLEIQYQDGDLNKGLEEEFAKDLLFTKYEHWRYEEETRAIVKLDHATIENGLYFYPFDERLILREVILGPMCEIPIEGIRQLVHSTYEGTAVIKARLAYKWFTVAQDEKSVQEENEYWMKQIGRPFYEPKEMRGQ